LFLERKDTLLEQRPKPRWTIFSNHGTILFYVAANPDATIRTMSETLGLTERQISRILRDLEDGGLLEAERHGRRNSYTVNPDAYLRHPALSHVKLRRVIEALATELEGVGIRSESAE
jgi:DNA-binding IclR family transcriptional regulator